MKNIFISHSSKNKDIAEQFTSYLEKLGIKSKNIFCSSVISQGIKNGENLNSAIGKAIKKSHLLIYLISNDFVESSYCMEELGVGWYLAQEHNKKCFYLLLPDINAERLRGFVNSKIQQFSFISKEKEDDLVKLSNDICKALCIRQKNITEQTRYKNSFFCAIEYSLDKLKNNAQLKENELISLKEQLKIKDETISKYSQQQAKVKEETHNKLLEQELRIIEKRFFILGCPHGINIDQYKCLSKTFWFDMINRYEELLHELKRESSQYDMLILIASIYMHAGKLDKAYEYYIQYVKNCETVIYYNYLSDFATKFQKSMKEVIEILRIKISKEKEGLEKDSYIDTLKKLEKRETQFE